MKTRNTWTHRGINIFPAGPNSNGIRWVANANLGYTIRSSTKDGMRKLINEIIKPEPKPTTELIKLAERAAKAQTKEHNNPNAPNSTPAVEAVKTAAFLLGFVGIRWDGGLYPEVMTPKGRWILLG